MAKRHLLIIDPQNDFCDLPAAYCPIDPQGRRLAPALPVDGAHADMQRLAALIDGSQNGLNAITVTLDSHHLLDIAHTPFWQDAQGGAVAPFTQITAADLRAGRYRPRDPSLHPHVQSYLDALEATGRRTHTLWPVHCQIGSWGHNIHADLHQTLNRWELARDATVAKISKGENPLTEHFSALQAEVPDPSDIGTQLNTTLLARLCEADRLYIAGEAGSHCVKATTEHLVEHWPREALGKLTLIEDAISPVKGFEADYANFLADMRARGVRILLTHNVLKELPNDANLT